MAKIYGSESAYVRGIDKFYTKRWLIFMGILILIIILYALGLNRLMQAPLGVKIAIPFIFLGVLKFLGYFLDINELGSVKAYRGLRGEEEVLKVLQKLPDTFSVFRGLQINGPWDVDFVVVGPTGVFTIEAKSHKGKIGFDGNQLTHNSYNFPEKDILKQAMTQAWDTHNYLQSSIGQDIFVKPIVVFARAKTRFGIKPINNVTVIQTQWLEEVISSAHHKPFDYEGVAESLRSLTKIPKTNIMPGNSKSF